MFWRRRRWASSGALIFLVVFLGYSLPRWWHQWQVKVTTALNNVPSPRNVQKAMVLAKMKHEDIRWVHRLRPDWTPYIYTASSPPEEGYRLTPRAYRGREAITYLSFIVDFYDRLPDIAAFVHASDDQRHNEDLGSLTSSVLKKLRVQAVERHGYVNLRCNTNPNCPVGVTPHSWSKTDEENDDVRMRFVDHYRYLFNVTSREVPEEIGGVCCAQFAVTREQIRSRPKSDYERMLNWISKTKEGSQEIGWVFESIWHIVFGKPSIHCPDADQCRCDLFGVGCAKSS